MTAGANRPLVEALPEAPFATAAARLEGPARAVWLTASDGVRLRAGILGHGPRGTVLLLQGRTEYLEKYGLAAAELAARGYGTVAIDFRGQGLSERPLADPLIGHVADFAHYQRDVAALAGFAAAAGLPRPWYLLAHSMGGAIGLRALIEGLDVRAAAFSAPMWGVTIAAPLRPVAWSLGWLGHRLALDGWRAPGTTRGSYVRTVTAVDNLLTHDPDMLAYMQAHLDALPGIDLGGPSVPWLYRALAECRALRGAPPPEVPGLIAVPSEEQIVCPRAMRAVAARWPGADLLEVPGARHEVMMETPPRRRAFFDACAELFARNP